MDMERLWGHFLHLWSMAMVQIREFEVQFLSLWSMAMLHMGPVYEIAFELWTKTKGGNCITAAVLFLLVYLVGCLFVPRVYSLLKQIRMFLENSTRFLCFCAIAPFAFFIFVGSQFFAQDVKRTIYGSVVMKSMDNPVRPCGFCAWSRETCYSDVKTWLCPYMLVAACVLWLIILYEWIMVILNNRLETLCNEFKTNLNTKIEQGIDTFLDDWQTQNAHGSGENETKKKLCTELKRTLVSLS